ncbi:NAD(P)H-binding protein [Arthrobacter sp. NEB 688]|uniref:NAD(P)-dependent oxidoreductase n=1 Tax=Arthrobacter sp. NEB 688 TaxID=904039 RepID=UPI00156796FD|nr:NAD(P)H-binding protein [Arthrobacter sp. NEB 688]QKE84622.1 NAD(P)H-binding protein [Arthrobacter sp. NEB 688]
MSTLLVLGGSGRTGIHVLAHAVARGHHVRALVRDPSRVAAPEGVQLITGTPARIDDIRRAAEGADAVISVLNNGRASDNPWAAPVSPPTFMTDAARSTLTVMGEQGITRIVATSSQGVAEDWRRISPLMRGLITHSNIKVGFADHNGVDAALRASDVDWTLARAVALTDRPARGPLHAAVPGTGKPGRFVNRSDLAGFLVDTVENDAWVRRAPLVWNARR